MATAIPFEMVFQTTTGTPVSGVKVYVYAPGTTTPRTAYSDTGLTVPIANPYIGNSAGYVAFYLSSEIAYRIVAKSADDSITYYDQEHPSNISGAQPVDATLTALAGLTVADDDYIQGTGADTFRTRKLHRATYAALTAIAAASRFDGMLIYVAARTTAGDGGEGWWRFDSASSATANSGTILAPDAGTGRWIRQGLKDGKISLRWFGTDATALQAAFDYMETDSTISRLFIPNGTYTIASTCTYNQATLGRSITIEGEDMLETVLSYTGSATNGLLAFVLGQAASQIANRLVIRNMSLTTAVVNAGAAIKTTRTASSVVAPNTVFEDLYVYQTGSGYWTYDIWSIDASDTWFNRLYLMNFGSSTTACVFIDNNLTTQSVYGAYFYGCSMNGGTYNVRNTGQLESIYFTNCSLVGATDLISLDATGTSFGNPHLTVAGCHLNGKRRDIHTVNWRAIQVTGTDVYAGVGSGDVAGSAILITSASHVTITGCKFEVGSVGVSRTFVELTTVEDFSITGNIMHNATAAGIIISGTSGRGVISSNTIEGYDDGTPNNEGIYSYGTVGQITYTGNKISYFAKGIDINCSNNVIVGNTLSNMTTGVTISGGSNNLADNNIFASVTTEYSGTIRRTIYRDVTVNPASVAAGARGTTVVAVTGAALGDFVGFAAPYDITDMQITANVISAGFVGLYMKNDTGSAIDLASGTWKFRLQS